MSLTIYWIAAIVFAVEVVLAAIYLYRLNFAMFLSVLVVCGNILFLYILLAATMRCLGEIAENTRVLALYARLQNQKADFEYDDGTEVEVWRDNEWQAGVVDASVEPPSVRLKGGTAVVLAEVESSDIRPRVLA
jgi:hypothetical protein